MKHTNYKFLILGLSALAISSSSFAQDALSASNIYEKVALSNQDQIVKLEKENNDLKKTLASHKKIIKTKQNRAQHYKHSLTYETGSTREETQKKQDAILNEIRTLQKEKSEMNLKLNSNEKLIEKLKKEPIIVPPKPALAIPEVPKVEPIKPIAIPKEVPVEVVPPPVNIPPLDAIPPLAMENPYEEPGEFIDDVLEINLPPMEEEIEEEEIPDHPLYSLFAKHNVIDIADSIGEAGEIQKLNETPGDYNKLIEKFKSLKNNTPYTESLKSSLENIKLFENNMVLKETSKENQWIAGGKIISSHSKEKSKISTNNYGAISSVEYRLGNETSLGFSLGGSNSSSSLKNNSSLKGTSLYLGTYLKKNFNKIKTTTGMGYQLSDLKSKRDNNSKNFKQNGYNLFSEVGYTVDFSETFHMEPKMRLSYFHISQDAIKENYNNESIAMSVKKAQQKNLTLFLGSDFTKDSYFKNGKLSTGLTFGVTNNLGNRNISATGNILGKNGSGRNFKLESEKLSKINGITGINLHFETNYNVTYEAGVQGTFGNNSNKNLQFNIGGTYKF
ncbi:MAG: autotransporter domain-containing protein [Cetobacterium sp.]|uniref:autotransporter outer membrane beta-barrel domain-containing protein n=1 Tax=Cetobacterium sp. TaxID=2071632 RepID=UPI003F2ECD9E